MASVTTDRRLGLAGNTAYKTPVTAIATTNITLSGEQTVGSVAVKAVNSAGVADRVLCTGQTTAADNGIWDVSTASWSRSLDSNGNYDLAQGTQVLITQGSGANQIWTLTTANPITVGTTAQTWSQNLSAGFLSTLAGSGGAALVGWIRSATGAVARTLAAKVSDEISVFDFMSTAQIADVQANTLSLDVTTPFQAALTALTQGQTLRVPGGSYKITTMLTMGTQSTTLALEDGAVISFNTSNFAALQLNATYCTVKGGKGGGFVGPASWASTTGGTPPSYAVIWITANNCTVQETRLSNVKQQGIWFKDVIDGAVLNCVIEGNYPTGQWTGVETVHFGISFDPALSSDPAGNLRVIGNSIKSCVQGCFVGNYGSGQFSQGVTITGNIFNDCWNHGVYTNYTSGAIISGNTFNRCEQMVAISGPYNAVVGNTSYTSVSSNSDKRDLIGISFRDPQGCICSGNVMKGANDVNTPTLINFQNFDGTTPMSQNVIEGNVLESTAGVLTQAIRVISTTTAVSGNIVRGNSIKAAGTSQLGMIWLEGSAGVQSEGNIVSDNSIILLGDGYGVQFYYMDGSSAHHNTVNYAYNAGGAVSQATIHFYQSTKCTAEANQSVCTSSYGTNITITGFLEDTGCSLNRVINSRNSVDSTHATYVTLTPLGSSKLDINDGGTETPNWTANPGSMWRRNSSTAFALFIHEAAYTSTLWSSK